MGMFGYWTKCARCWESYEYCKCTEEELLAFNKECALTKWEQEFPSKTVKPVFRGDIIGNYNKETQKVDNEFYVSKIGPQGQVLGRYVDGRDDGKEQEWIGEFDKVCSVL